MYVHNRPQWGRVKGHEAIEGKLGPGPEVKVQDSQAFHCMRVFGACCHCAFWFKPWKIHELEHKRSSYSLSRDD